MNIDQNTVYSRMRGRGDRIESAERRLRLAREASKTIQEVRGKVVQLTVEGMFKKVETLVSQRAKQLSKKQEEPDLICLLLEQRQQQHLPQIEDKLWELQDKRMQNYVVVRLEERSWVNVLFELKMHNLAYKDLCVIGISHHLITITEDAAKLFFFQFEGTNTTLFQFSCFQGLSKEGKVRVVSLTRQLNMSSLFFFRMLLSAPNHALLPLPLLALLYSLPQAYFVSFDEQIQLFENAVTQQILTARSEPPQEGLSQVVREGLSLLLALLRQILEDSEEVIDFAIMNAFLLQEGICLDFTGYSKDELELVQQLISKSRHLVLKEKLAQAFPERRQRQSRKSSVREQLVNRKKLTVSQIFNKSIGILREEFVRMQKSSSFFSFQVERFMARVNPNLEWALVRALQNQEVKNEMAKDPARGLWEAIRKSRSSSVDLAEFSSRYGGARAELQYGLAVCKLVGCIVKPQRNRQKVKIERAVFANAVYKAR